MAAVEKDLREFLSDWRFWMGIAYFGLAAVVCALYVLFGRTAHDEAIRAAAQRSAASSQVATCFTALKNAPVVQGFLDGQDALLDNSILSNEAAIKASSASDPLLSVRVKALERLRPARTNSSRLRMLVAETTPTREKCLELARKLGVDASRYTN